MATVSIIVSIYGVEKYLDRCVQSILDQSYRDFECILVDDGSPDRCGAKCDAWANKDQRIKVIHQENKGPSAARNEGLRRAEGEYLCFVDSDDYIHPDMIRELYDDIARNNADLSVCCFQHVDENGHRVELTSHPLERIVIDRITALECLNTNVNFIFIWNKLYKRTLFENIRFPFGKWHEDTFTIHEILFGCSRIALDPQKLYYYVQREGSISHSHSSFKRLDDVEAYYERVRFYEKNGLQKLIPAVVNVMMNKYAERVAYLDASLETTKKRIREIKKMVRSCYRKYFLKVRKINIFKVECLALYQHMHRFKKRLGTGVRRKNAENRNQR